MFRMPFKLFPIFKSISFGINVCLLPLKGSFLVIIFITTIKSIYGQELKKGSLNEQITFTVDNNFLLFNGDDGYYTSGLFLRYDRLKNGQNKASDKKVIMSYEVGQKIYTAYNRKILPNPTKQFPGGIDQIDRPIAGYLYGKATYASFNNDRMWSFGISAGSIGENSQGRFVQEFWHKMIGIKEHWNWVWDYQVKNEFGVNVQSSFAKALIKASKHPYFQITPITKAVLGTSFTNASQSVLFQLGKMSTISNSGQWHSKLERAPTGTSEERLEYFFYYQPMVKYQLYNATIQGGLFREDKGPIISEIKPLIVAHELGVRFSNNRYDIAYAVIFQSMEAINQFYWQSYASLILAYRF